MSVDLIGSTALKAQDQSSATKWRDLFLDFYRDFPDELQAAYFHFVIGNCSEEAKLDYVKFSPKVWKLLGDEIIFVNKAISIEHLAISIEAFRKTVKQYAEKLVKYRLDLKACAWVCSFPSPNICFKIPSQESTADEEHLPNEKLEKQADAKPVDFDYLGSGVDAGFRLSRYSTAAHFCISPAVAIMLSKFRRHPDLELDKDSKVFDIDLVAHESLKGVIGGEDYPILTINAEKNPKLDELRAKRRLVSNQTEIDHEKLEQYLIEFMEFYEIEMPALKSVFTDSKPKEPDYYSNWKENWQVTSAELDSRKELEEISASQDPESEGSAEEIEKFVGRVKSQLGNLDKSKSNDDLDKE